MQWQAACKTIVDCRQSTIPIGLESTVSSGSKLSLFLTASITCNRCLNHLLILSRDRSEWKKRSKAISFPYRAHRCDPSRKSSSARSTVCSTVSCKAIDSRLHSPHLQPSAYYSKVTHWSDRYRGDSWNTRAMWGRCAFSSQSWSTPGNTEILMHTSISLSELFSHKLLFFQLTGDTWGLT